MIGGVKMVGDGKVALAVTVEGFIARRCDNPVIPANVAEIDVQRPSLADVTAVFPTMAFATTRCSPRTRRIPDRALFVAPIVGVGEEKWLSLRPVLRTIIYASF